MTTGVHPGEPAKVDGCALCAEPGGSIVVQAVGWRVVRVDDERFPAFYRVIWESHVREFSQLSRADRIGCMDAVASVEATLVQELEPDKVNLAALGNVVPHLHWHVVARFRWDSHFPQPIWGEAQRHPAASDLQRLRERLPRVDEALRAVLG